MAPSQPNSSQECRERVNKNRQKQSFLKRNSTLKKKASELATLCGIQVCMVCYGPDGKVHTWPENLEEVKDVIMKYKGANKHGKSHKKLDLSGFLEAEKKKLEKKKYKSVTKNFERLIFSWTNRLDGLSEASLKEILGFCEFKLQGLKERIKFLEEEEKQAKERNISPCSGGICQTQNALADLNGFHVQNIDLDLELNKESFSFTALLNGDDEIGCPNPNSSGTISPWAYSWDNGTSSHNVGFRVENNFDFMGRRSSDVLANDANEYLLPPLPQGVVPISMWSDSQQPLLGPQIYQLIYGYGYSSNSSQAPN